MKRRHTLIAGNWKMNKTIADTQAFFRGLEPILNVASAEKVWLAVPFTAIHSAFQSAKHLGIAIGAQNVSDHEDGAYTGEISAKMLKEAGAKFVIIGHSERRHYFHETDAQINKKLKKALEERLQAILCIGDTLLEHEEGIAFKVLERQLVEGLAGIDFDALRHVVIAYEPVWAIGTNRAAGPELAQSVHAHCRKILATLWGMEAAQDALIIYGGSVNPDNAKGLISQPDIDGLLVGNASLSYESFNKILECGKMKIF